VILEQILVQEKLINFVCRNFIVDKEDIILDQSLVDQGIIDSFGLVEISGFLQKEFKIPVLDSDMNRQNFGSVLKIVDFVTRKSAS
jgi:acyl carrier protein